MNRRFLAILNGAAGGGRCRARADAVLVRLREAGFELDLRITEGRGHATELARDAWDEGHRHFISIGGDGTAYEVINGLFPRSLGDDRPTLSILPLGTGNSFLRDFGVAHESAALDAIFHGRSRSCDVVRIDHRDGVLFYLNILGIGFVARAGDLTNRRFKKLGAAGYGFAVLGSVATLEYAVDPYRIDGGDIDSRPSTFVCFCNSRYTGGSMMMAPHADATDGQVDVIRVGVLRRRDLVSAFPRIFQGSHVHMPEIEESRGKKVLFEKPRLQPVMIDGEILELEMRGLEVIPGALEVIV